MVAFDRIAEIIKEQRAAALCIVTSTKGSTPRKAGARMVVIANGADHGEVEGTIGGGAIEHKVRLAAINVIRDMIPKQINVALTNELGMCCGGQMTVYIEPIRTKPPCIIFGAGHIGEALCRLSAQAGFSVTIADPREELVNIERFSLADKLISDYTRHDFAQMPFGPDAFIVIATHCHQTDQKITEEVLKRDFCYAALVGSKRKAAMTRERCLNKGFIQEQISRLECPAGLAIGAQTPEEIAFSIIGKMIQVRRAPEHL